MEQRNGRCRQSAPLREEIKAKAVRARLWAPHLSREYGGKGLDFLSLQHVRDPRLRRWRARTLWDRRAELGQRQHSDEVLVRKSLGHRLTRIMADNGESETMNQVTSELRVQLSRYED